LDHLQLHDDLVTAKSYVLQGELLTLVTTKYAGREFLTRSDGMIYKGDFLFPLEQLGAMGLPLSGIQAPPFSETRSLKAYTCPSLFSWFCPAKPATAVPLSHVSASAKGTDHTLLLNTDLSTTCISFSGELAGKPVRVLLDGGSMSNFVSNRTVGECGLTLSPLDTLVKVVLADGSSSLSNHVTTVDLSIGSLNTSVSLLPTELASYDVILGKPWLTKYNPHINWRLNTVSLTHEGKTHLLVGERGSHLPDYLISAVEAQEAIDADMPVYLVHLRHLSTSPSSTSSSPELEAVLDEFKDVLSGLPPNKLPPSRAEDHFVRLMPDCKPPASKLYPLSPAQLSELRSQLTELLDRGFIRPSESPYGAPILFVKKHDGGWRMCVDYRDLNKITVRNQHPLPRIDEMFQQLQGAKYFSKLDLASGYHQIRMHPDSIETTAFKCKYGHFEYTVMPFGLKNAPGTFQAVMNRVLGPYLDDFCMVYLDDILIYSKTLEEHLTHLRKILTLLRKHQFYCKRSKCLFLQSEVPYLGFLITADGLKVDPSKIAAIREWPTPTCVSELRSFMGLVQFFDNFIPHFADVSFPLTQLFKKDAAWEWTPVQDTAFLELKRLTTESPCLIVPDPSLPYVIHTDASGFAVGCALFQGQGAGLQPVAFESRKLQPPERNLAPYDRELLGIVHALTKWRHLLLGAQFTLYTDQQALKYLLSSPTRTSRQERWLSLLMEFMPDIKYIPGSDNVVADALSRRVDLQSVAVAPRLGGDLLALIREGYATDDSVPALIRDGTLHFEGELLYTSAHQIYVSPGAVRERVVHECHGVPYHGHLGSTKTKETVCRHFWWPAMASFVRKFCAACPICQRTKGSTKSPMGLLAPLPVPTAPWESVSMDLVTDLSKCCGHDSIVVFVDRLTKAMVLAPCCKTITAPQMAQLFIDTVFRRFGFPANIVSDRDPRFTSKFWSCLMDLLGTSLSMSTAAHPETDGQTERANRTIEEMLRAFVNTKQNDWCRFLALVEHAYNNSVQASTQQTPFFLNHGRHQDTPLSRAVPARAAVPAVAEFVEGIQEALKSAKACIHVAQQRQKFYADKKRRPHRFAVGDQVLLLVRPDQLPVGMSPKLAKKFSGPYSIVEAIGPNAFRLDLPSTVGIHDVVNASQLKPYVTPSPTLTELLPRPPPLRVDKRGEIYEVKRILGKRHVGQGAARKVEYYVAWKGYPMSEASWQPEKHVKHLKEDCRAAPFLSGAQVKELLRANA
jgi:hypothetical protein